MTGKATGGPAAFQSPPANVLPKLDLEMDSEGYLWILPPVWDLRANGIIGYGRYLNPNFYRVNGVGLSNLMKFMNKCVMQTN